MSLLKYVEGDIFKPVLTLPSSSVILMPHVCNDRGAWGSGFVVPLARHFPKTRDRYLAWFKTKDNLDPIAPTPPADATYPGGLNFQMGNTQLIQVSENPRVLVFNMVAQTLGGLRPLYYNMLARCMDAVAEERLKYPSAEIHCPMFGSNLAGGDWNVIEQLIYDCWLRDHKIPTTVYYLPGTLPDNWRPPSEGTTNEGAKTH